MNLLDILNLGEDLTDFRNKKAGSIVIGDKGITGILKNILSILKKNTIVPENHYIIKNMIKSYKEKYKAKNKLTPKGEKELEYYWSLIYSFILNGLRDRVVFSAYIDGDLSVRKLSKGAKSFFSSNIWKKLQEIEKQDLDDCTKCLLIENWTPAGVMAMRAIESAVREYFFKLTNQRKTQWWKILDELKTNQNANQDLVEELDYIRKHIRNPLAHPEDRIETHTEAGKAFLHARDILSKIYS